MYSNIVKNSLLKLVDFCITFLFATSLTVSYRNGWLIKRQLTWLRYMRPQLSSTSFWSSSSQGYSCSNETVDSCFFPETRSTRAPSSVRSMILPRTKPAWGSAIQTSSFSSISLFLSMLRAGGSGWIVSANEDFGFQSMKLAPENVDKESIL